MVLLCKKNVIVEKGTLGECFYQLPGLGMPESSRSRATFKSYSCRDRALDGEDFPNQLRGSSSGGFSATWGL